MSTQISAEESMMDEIQLVVFNLEGEEFGANICDVREIIKMEYITRIPGAPFFVEGIINLRGQISTVIDLRKMFRLHQNVKGDENRIIVVEHEENVIGMIVDTVSEVLWLKQSNIEKTPSIITTKIDSKFLKGVGKMEDRLIILVDLAKILSVKELDKLAEFSNQFQTKDTLKDTEASRKEKAGKKTKKSVKVKNDEDHGENENSTDIDMDTELKPELETKSDKVTDTPNKGDK